MAYVDPVNVFHVRVYGVARPQGSKIPGVSKAGKAFVREQSGAQLNQWRKDIVDAAVKAREASDHQTLDGALGLQLIFFMPRPASIPAKKRTHPSVRPDLDKMIRAVGDALKAAGVYGDDAQICQITALKKYMTDDPECAPGVDVSLWKLSEII